MSSPPPTPNPSDLLNQVASQLQSQTLHARQCKQQRGSRLPYFDAHHANIVAEILCEVDEKQTPFLWHAAGVKLETLDAKYRQGLQYLIEFLDEDNSYKSLVKRIKVIKCGRIGLRFAPVLGATATTLVPMDDEWKVSFNTFLESCAPNSTWERFIALNESDQAWLMAVLDGVKEFITHNQPKQGHIMVHIPENI